MLHKSRLENILLLSRTHQKNKTQKGHFRVFWGIFFSPLTFRSSAALSSPRSKQGTKQELLSITRGVIAFSWGLWPFGTHRAVGTGMGMVTRMETGMGTVTGMGTGVGMATLPQPYTPQILYPNQQFSLQIPFFQVRPCLLPCLPLPLLPSLVLLT